MLDKIKARFKKSTLSCFKSKKPLHIEDALQDVNNLLIAPFKLNTKLITDTQTRKKAIKVKFQHAVKEFGRVSTKSNQDIPKEEQVSIDLGNKMMFNYKTQQLARVPLTPKSITCMQEIGSEGKELYNDLDTITKYFSPQEQEKHTRIPTKLTAEDKLKLYNQYGELKLCNQDGSLYDTGDGTKGSDPYGRVMYAITLDGKIITHPEIQPAKGIKYWYLHSTLLGGGPGICFGTMKVIYGRICYISNHSGHYKPTEENLYNAIKRLEGLFIKNALVVFHCANFNESGDIEINEEKRKILFTKRWCTVEEFLEAIEKGIRVARGEQDKVIMPKRYFEYVRNYNESYRDLLIRTSYKPVPVFNRNVKIAVEHSIRKIIGAGFGHKPILAFDIDVLKITISFRNENNALRFYSILQEQKLQDSELQQLDNNKYIISVCRFHAYKFFQNILKISMEDIQVLIQELELKNTLKTKIEYIIGRFINNSFNDPVINFNHKTDKITISFYYYNDAWNFYSFLQKNNYQNSKLQFNHKYIISLSKESMLYFLHMNLKLSIEDITVLCKELGVKIMLKTKIEYSIAESIGIDLNRKPILSVDEKTFQIITCFYDDNDLCKYLDLLQSKYEGSTFKFFQYYLKLDRQDINTLNKELILINKVKTNIEDTIARSIGADKVIIGFDEKTLCITVSFHGAEDMLCTFKLNSIIKEYSRNQKFFKPLIHIDPYYMYKLLQDIFSINEMDIARLTQALVPRSDYKTSIDNIDEIKEITCFSRIYNKQRN